MQKVNGRKLMSDAKFYESYARFIDDQNRYETWQESVKRVMDMHRLYYKDKMTLELENILLDVEKNYSEKMFLGAQRALQFGGKQLIAHPARNYNCAASYANRPDFFGGLFYLLLCGAGVGFSVQNHHIAQLPKIQKRSKSPKQYIVPDSIEGWASTVDVLLSSYFTERAVHPEYSGRKVYFDLSQIRPRGAFISGGFKAPGSEPLRKALDKIELLIENELKNGYDKLRSIVVYDICMYIADAVISGGVRRSATICIFSKNDTDMLSAKTGDWYIDNPQRGRSNNSVILLRNETSEEEFVSFMEYTKNYGEPGVIWSDSLDFIFNPCVEIALYPYCPEDNSYGFQMCNLTEINGAVSTTKEIFFNQCKIASILGTLQAGYTDFKFFKDSTKKIVEKESLIGVGITGMVNNPNILFDPDILREGARVVKYWNKKIAEMIGINVAARTTTIKPSGNASVILQCASGIHGEHSKKYLRHIQFNKNTEVAQILQNKNQCMCEPSFEHPDRDIVVAFPILSPSESIFKQDLLGIKQLEYVKLVQNSWIEEGTNVELCTDERLRHNVSNTITVDDWDNTVKYIYDNRKYLCGVSLLASIGDKAYAQAPFTEVLDYNQIVSEYGEVSLFTSALIEVGLKAFNNNLWLACNTALGWGEKLTEESKDLLKRDFVRRFDKFSKHFNSKEDCSNCLKDVYNLHKYWKIVQNIKDVDWSKELKQKKFTDIDTMAGANCYGGACEIQ